MQLKRILKVTLIIMCLTYLAFQIMDLEFEAAGAKVTSVLLLTLLYCIRVQSKRLLFLLFLVCFSLAEIVVYSKYFVQIDYEHTIDYSYYFGNGLYILSYIFLTLRVLKDMAIKTVFKKFWIHILILLVLDVFCVVILSDTIIKLMSNVQSLMELTFNIVIMALLTIAMINYMSKNTQKSMNLLLGAIFIFFSEVIQMTYFYIADINILNVMCSLFMVLAFLFLYLQARIPFETEQQAMQRDLRV